ncbi:MAG: hypothetical protein RR812_03965 [Vagococcus sp.]
MNKSKELDEMTKALKQTSDKLIDTANILADISETLEAAESPQNRVAIRLLETLSNELIRHGINTYDESEGE